MNNFIAGVSKLIKFFASLYFFMVAVGGIIVYPDNNASIVLLFIICFYALGVFIIKIDTRTSYERSIDKNKCNKSYGIRSISIKQFIIAFIFIFISFIASFQYNKNENILLLIIIFAFYIVGTVILLKKEKNISVQTPLFTSVKQKEYNPIGGMRHFYLHQQGLPTGIDKEGIFDFFLCKDKIVILCEPYEIVINKEELKDIYYQNFKGERVLRTSKLKYSKNIISEYFYGVIYYIRMILPKFDEYMEKSDYKMIIKYTSKEGVLKEISFNCKGNLKYSYGIRKFCEEVGKALLGEEELQIVEQETIKKINIRTKTKVGIGLLILSILGFLSFIIDTSNKEPIYPSIMFLIIGVLTLLINPKSKEEISERLRQSEYERFIKTGKLIKNKMGATKGIYVGWDRMLITHIEGLPIASGIGCEIYYRDGYYEIKGAGFTFRIDMDKITDISIKDHTYSNGRSSTSYMIITYLNEGMIRWIRLSYRSSENLKAKEWKILFDYDKYLKENNNFNNENTYHI